MNTHSQSTSNFTRRDFVKASALTAGGVALASSAAASLTSFIPGMGVHRGDEGRIKVGVIGCGGRGTGALVNSLEGSPDTVIHAVGDVFKDRLDGAMGEISKLPSELKERCQIGDRQFVGFDAYKQVIGSGIDLAILATPPHFRPMHFEAAINAGKHVFFEKPVAVDPAGIRKVIAAAQHATEKGLSVVTGTQRRHQTSYLEAMKRVEGGAIGKVVAANCWWNQGDLWHREHDPKWSDMEWQLRNWLYFTWLSGDHIVEQHVHNIDVCNWAIGSTPLRCVALGGRQVRTQPQFGHIFDHFAVQYEYADGVVMNSQCRQIVGCVNKVAEQIIGTDGILNTADPNAQIVGKNPWKHDSKKNNAPYVQEHTDLVASVLGEGPRLNEGKRVAESTLTAIMGRMAAYTGKEVTWEFAMNSKLDLSPPAYEFGSLPVPDVAMPGRTPLV
ncbi:MAG: Gfo/Idh/MocA family protein [Phycisphaerales bacterium]